MGDVMMPAALKDETKPAELGRFALVLRDDGTASVEMTGVFESDPQLIHATLDALQD